MEPCSSPRPPRGGQPGLGLGIFAVMVIFIGVPIAFGGRSETVGVLRGQPADERLAGFSLAATAVAVLAAIVIAPGGFVWQIAHGQSGSDFAVVAAAAGIAYPGALLWVQVACVTQGGSSPGVPVMVWPARRMSTPDQRMSVMWTSSGSCSSSSGIGAAVATKPRLR